jgi:hypothetical protein
VGVGLGRHMSNPGDARGSRLLVRGSQILKGGWLFAPNILLGLFVVLLESSTL